MDYIHPILRWNYHKFSCVNHFPLEINFLPNNSTERSNNNIFLHRPQVVEQPPQIEPILYLNWKIVDLKTIFPDLIFPQLVSFILQTLHRIKLHFSVDMCIFFSGILMEILTKVPVTAWEFLSPSEDLLRAIFLPSVNLHFHAVI